VALSPNEDSMYFCGNSLGLMPRQTKELVNQELDVWASSYMSQFFTYCNVNSELLFLRGMY
jgi:kynureninase